MKINCNDIKREIRSVDFFYSGKKNEIYRHSLKGSIKISKMTKFDREMVKMIKI